MIRAAPANALGYAGRMGMKSRYASLMNGKDLTSSAVLKTAGSTVEKQAVA